MVGSFRMLTWNCKGASARSTAWDFLLELDPDVALLQEVGSIPARVSEIYRHIVDTPVTKSGGPQRFATAVLAKGEITGRIELQTRTEWVARELEFFRGNFMTAQVRLHSGLDLKVISVYSPAFPVDPARLVGIDTRGIQLTQNRDVWATEILWTALRELAPFGDELFAVGGDFNSSETFDWMWRGGPRGNREIIERMNALGLQECLRTFQGRLTPTFRNTTGGKVVHQIDHLYVTRGLLDRLVSCNVGPANRVFEPVPALSDHLPIIADFAS